VDELLALYTNSQPPTLSPSTPCDTASPQSLYLATPQNEGDTFIAYRSQSPFLSPFVSPAVTPIPSPNASPFPSPPPTPCPSPSTFVNLAVYQDGLAVSANGIDAMLIDPALQVNYQDGLAVPNNGLGQTDPTPHANESPQDLLARPAIVAAKRASIQRVAIPTNHDCPAITRAHANGSEPLSLVDALKLLTAKAVKPRRFSHQILIEGGCPTCGEMWKGGKDRDHARHTGPCFGAASALDWMAKNNARNCPTNCGATDCTWPTFPDLDHYQEWTAKHFPALESTVALKSSDRTCPADRCLWRFKMGKGALGAALKHLDEAHGVLLPQYDHFAPFCAEHEVW
jgi:hypothetical protein